MCPRPTRSLSPLVAPKCSLAEIAARWCDLSMIWMSASSHVTCGMPTVREPSGGRPARDPDAAAAAPDKRVWRVRRRRGRPAGATDRTST